MRRYALFSNWTFNALFIALTQIGHANISVTPHGEKDAFIHCYGILLQLVGMYGNYHQGSYVR